MPFLTSSEAAGAAQGTLDHTAMAGRWEEEGREVFQRGQRAVLGLQQGKCCRYWKVVCVQSTNTVGSSEFSSMS